jgi:tetratricopeptide (TPR) repeat protein
MKRPILLIGSIFLFSTTLVLYPILSTEKTIVQAQEANLNSAQAYLERGISYAEQGKYELAIADYNRAIEINSNYAHAYNNRGNYYNKQGKHELAIADYNRAIEINPNYAHAYYNRGLTYLHQGKDKLARTDLEKAKQLFLAQGDAASVKEIDRLLKVLA